MRATLPSESKDRGTDPSRSPLIPATEKKPAGASASEKLCIDEMLQKYCGEFGRWQLKHFILTSLAWALEAFHTMVIIFADREPEWQCLDGAAGSGCDPAAKNVCRFEPGSWKWVGDSTVAEWGLFCGDKFKVGLVQAVFFGGCMIGAGIFGHLSDSFLGRKGSLTVVCALNTVFGTLTAFSPSYSFYVLFRLLTGCSTGGVGLCAFVLATEPVGPKMRGTVGMSTFYFFSSGIALLSAIAYIFPAWRNLYIVSSLSSLVFLVFVLPFVSESPRWYLVRGRKSEAMKIMSTIATSNGNHLPQGVILTMDNQKPLSLPLSPSSLSYHVSVTTTDTCMKEQHLFKDINPLNKLQLSCQVAMTGSLLDVIRTPMTRARLVLAVVINFLCSVVYYGLSLNVVNLETNLYLTVILNAVAEMPAFMITAMLLDRWGRKPLTIGTLWFSGAFCFAGSLVNNVGVWKGVRVVCGILGIFGMAGTYNLLFIYTAELFPTVVRNAALGCATQAAQMGAILAPLVVVLGGSLPFLVFALCGIVGGVFAFYLPETLNQPLYDTLTGMEAKENTAISTKV
ncbi:organic cation/carnitine transporter 4-like [Glycine soja]|uniref:Organic cation/carnitine transporter 4 n=1 Tax=Glycine soja TaxID=3848 RepID=A0A445KES7_GLYSO|nr:organic cation/carnitine transporter 4-like [Glycine soja]RZC09298.1 Organic cation/carnitine transporter 4 [Glycine soja]